MAPLAAADVRLVGAFHVVSGGSACGSGEYRRTAPALRFPQSAFRGWNRKSLLLGTGRCPCEQRTLLLPHLWTVVWKIQNPCKSAVFSSTAEACGPSERRSRWCYARPFPTTPDEREDGWSTPPRHEPTTSGTPFRAG